MGNGTRSLIRQLVAMAGLAGALGTGLPTLALARAPAAGQERPVVAAPPVESEAVRAARREAREKLKKEVLDQMRAMRMWKLTEELKLDQATAAKVFPLLAEFDDRGRTLGRERGEIARELHDLVRVDPVTGKAAAKAPDDPKLRPLVDRLLANQARRTALDDERFKALRPALTPLQQAKLLLLLPRIDEDFRHRVREALDAQRRAERGQAGLPEPSRR
jgi:hypothetical protein